MDLTPEEFKAKYLMSQEQVKEISDQLSERYESQKKKQVSMENTRVQSCLLYTSDAADE